MACGCQYEECTCSQAPNGVCVNIKKIEVTAGDSDNFIHAMWGAIDREIRMPPQFEPECQLRLSLSSLSRCIRDAAIEEMRVRAAYMRRSDRVPSCPRCGGLRVSPHPSGIGPTCAQPECSGYWLTG